MASLENNPKMYINELMTYVTYAHQNGSGQFLKNIIKCKFPEDDIIEGKQLLWQIGGATLGEYPARINSNQRPAVEAHIDDIIEAVEKLDSINKLPLFVAVNLGKVPDLEPEEYNRLYYINRVAKLEKSVNQHRDELDNMNRYILELKDEMKSQKAEMRENLSLNKSSNYKNYRARLIDD